MVEKTIQGLKEKKEAMEKFLKLSAELRDVEEELKDWKELAENEPVDAFYTGNIILKKEEMNQLKNEVLRCRAVILSAINNIADKRIRVILRRRYINGQNIIDISRCTHYSLRHVKRLHRRGLEIVSIPEKMSP